jgi:hypothetical protein
LSPIRSQQSLSPHSREGSTGYLQYSARGGKFSVSNPKSDVEWKILRAAQVPGPGSYGAAPLRMGGGKFSTCKPKSDTDWIVLRASQIPAPGQYKLPDTTLVSGGKFSQSRPKTSLDWAIYNGKKTPGMRAQLIANALACCSGHGWSETLQSRPTGKPRAESTVIQTKL